MWQSSIGLLSMWELSSSKAEISGQPLKKKEQYTIKILVAPVTTTTTTSNDFDTMVFNVEVDAYVKRKSMLEENTQKTYSLVLVQCTELLKRKINQSKGWSEASTKFDVHEIINTIKSLILKFEYQKHLNIYLHQAKTNFYTLHQGDMFNADYLEKSTYLRTWHLHLRADFEIKKFWIKWRLENTWEGDTISLTHNRNKLRIS